VGIADAIFDIVSSGSTLIANGLKEVETVFESEAVLIARPGLSEEEQALVDDLLFRIESENVSRGKKYLLMNLPKASLDEAIRILPAMRSPTVMPLASEDWCSLHSVIDAADLWTKVRQLKAIGAEGILVMDVDKIIL
jgi:ATP phosphoribosyltransferase